LDQGKPSLFPSIRIDKILNYSDYIILEEPEHLLWFKPQQNFKRMTNVVIGIIHTNYLFYIRNSNLRFVLWLIKLYSRILLKFKCSKIIHLSSVTKEIFPAGMVLALNGVRDEFFCSNTLINNFTGIYTYGKVILEKGYKELVDLLSFCNNVDPINCYGKNYDQEAISQYAKSKNVNLIFHSEVEDPAISLNKYAIFINPSVSEVLCTTTAEAIAMRKIVIIPKHISNEAFYKFSNVLVYDNKFEFKMLLSQAKSSSINVSKESVEDLLWVKVTKKYLLPLLH
jgi:digalactosyldiacylglycerol synthase